ncbi:MAG TPA: outer membrane beta-barrel protein [Xanthobacteraceae bacterium]|jgi:outer membrane immunogenic protein
MKSSIAGMALLAAISMPALAMDLTAGFQTLSPSATETPRDWSGFYGGANSWSVPYDALIAGAPVAAGSSSANSPLAGWQLGYNYQKGPFVFGIESDFTRRYGMDSVLLSPTGLDGLNLRDEQGWFGTLRPRAGLAADNWLVYATGGLAYGSFRNNDATEVLGPGSAAAVSASGARAGWTVGGGISYAGGDKQRWSLGLEYLYADFGKSLNDSPLGPFSSNASHDQAHLLRGRFNYQFDLPLLPQAIPQK